MFGGATVTNLLLVLILLALCVLIGAGMLYVIRSLTKYWDGLLATIAEQGATIKALTERVCKLEQANALRLPHTALDAALNAIALVDEEVDEADVDFLKAKQRVNRKARLKQILTGEILQIGTQGPKRPARKDSEL
jgi:hypothetical protein